MFHLEYVLIARGKVVNAEVGEHISGLLKDSKLIDKVTHYISSSNKI